MFMSVILDTETIVSNTYNTLIESFNKKYTDEIRLKIMGTTEKDACRVIVETLKLPCTPQELLDKYHETAYKNLDKCELMPGVQKFIKHLKSNNVPIAIGTSSSEEGFNVKTRRHKDFFSLFSHVVPGGSYPGIKGKPNPDIYERAAALFPEKPKPEKCLVFEDAPNGVAAALSAGMQCVIVPDKNTKPNLYKDATLVVKSIDQTDLSLFGLPSFGSVT